MDWFRSSTARLLVPLAEAEALPKAAGTDPAGQPVDPLGQLISMLGPLVALGLIFYFLVMRPESKRRKQREQTLNAIKPKDKVVTIGGLHGVVVDVEKEEVVLLVDPKKDIKLRFRRSAIDSIDAPALQEESKK